MANGLNAKIFSTIASAVVDRLVASPVTPQINVGNSAVVEKVVKDAIASDPVVVNQLNAEQPVQSRILWGNTIAGVGAAVVAALPVLVLTGMVSQEQADQIRDSLGLVTQGLAGVAVIGGIAYSTYGRIKTGLVPLFTKKT